VSWANGFADLVAWVAFARWSDTPWILRRRRARQAHLGCSCLSRPAPTGAWPGSASASAACREAGPRPSLPFIPSRVQSGSDQTRIQPHCKHVEQQSPHRVDRIMDRPATAEHDLSSSTRRGCPRRLAATGRAGPAWRRPTGRRLGRPRGRPKLGSVSVRQPSFHVAAQCWGDD
jgi:hypothetical protein